MEFHSIGFPSIASNESIFFWLKLFSILLSSRILKMNEASFVHFMMPCRTLVSIACHFHLFDPTDCLPSKGILWKLATWPQLSECRMWWPDIAISYPWTLRFMSWIVRACHIIGYTIWYYMHWIGDLSSCSTEGLGILDSNDLYRIP